MNGEPSFTHLDEIDRVLCLSDLHVDHRPNMDWLIQATKNKDVFSYTSKEDKRRITLSSSDLVVVAGDISHDLLTIRRSFSYLQRTGAKVFFVPGNHEAWLRSVEEARDNREASSLAKLEKVYQLCRQMGVYTECVCVGGRPTRPNTLWIVPMQSWYDGSLAMDGCEDLCSDFDEFPWVDFYRCAWPDFEIQGSPNNNIPKGLAKHFLERNEPMLQKLPKWIQQVDQGFLEGQATTSAPAVLESKATDCSKAIMTVSHFLPNHQCLPLWMDVTSPHFDREAWMQYGGGQMSAKFAKVAGTNLLDYQIRSIQKLPDTGSTPIRQIHVFGHSHRPKDMEYRGIRYIHNPLGNPKERKLYMVAPTVDFQVVWDTRKDGEIKPENPVICVWQEQGGGIEALRERQAKFSSSRASRP